jgi:hypothetical protein
MADPTLQSSDSWILVALLSATEERTFASLNDLIRAADAVNHAIITRGELETGFARLVPLGHAVVGANGYAPSKQLREYWATKTEGASLYQSWGKLAKHIGAPASHTGPLPETDEEQYVNKAAYEAVVASYAVNMPHPFLGEK